MRALWGYLNTSVLFNDAFKHEPGLVIGTIIRAIQALRKGCWDRLAVRVVNLMVNKLPAAVCSEK